MIEIKFCENNFSHGTEEVIVRLQNEVEGVSVEVESCLGYCGDCAVGPFALVNDELIQEDTPEELFESIMEQIKQ